MKLINAHVTGFRCIADSTEFRVGEVTCLVGKNESGKTSVLHALERLNPLDPDTKFNGLNDYPRYLFSDLDEELIVLKTYWELSSDDIAAVEEVTGPGTVKSNSLRVSKNYKNRSFWVVEIDDREVLDWLLSECGCNKEEREKLSACKDSAEAVRRVSDLKTLDSARVTSLTERIAKFRSNSARCAAIDILEARMPKFLYFASYDRMEGTVHSETLLERITAKKKTRSDEVFTAFLEYAGTSLEEILKVNQYEEIKARCEGASIKISRQIFEYWSQNRNLKVEFYAEPGRAGDKPPFNSGLVIRTRIHNKLHEMTVPFDDRSAGFTWFFSFLALFSQVQKSHGDVIILLDEPGLNLHGKAQADLVRFIYEKLRGRHQVLYTTHSPFMVPTDDLASVRTVEDVVSRDAEGEPVVHGTKVGDKVLSTDRDTLFPLQGALGYEITQSLFIGPHSLIVEGPSDILFLTLFSAELIRQRRTGLDPRWTLCPCGGIDKVAAFISLFGASGLHVAVLTDHSGGQKQKIDQLRKSKLLNDGHVFTTSDFCQQDDSDVEDLVGESIYLDIVNRSFDLRGKDKLSAKSLNEAGENSERVVKRVEAAFRLKPEARYFSHFEPASWLLQNQPYMKDGHSELAPALDRFEMFFKAVNALLP